MRGCCPHRAKRDVVHIQGGAYTRRCTYKAVHTKGRLWPPQKSYYLGGVRGCPPHRAKGAVVQIQGGAYTRRYTYKAVHTQGAAHKRPSVATARVLLFRGCAGVSTASSEASCSPHTRRCIHKAVHMQGCAHTRRCTQNAVCGHRTSLVIEGACGGIPRIERREP